MRWQDRDLRYSVSCGKNPVMLLQRGDNATIARVDAAVNMTSGATVDITMKSTVPLARPTCSDLSFRYNHHDGAETDKCVAFFKEGQMEHNISLRVKPTEGCRSYTSLLTFKPDTKPESNDTMWQNYVPNNVTVRFTSLIIFLKLC